MDEMITHMLDPLKTEEAAECGYYVYCVVNHIGDGLVEGVSCHPHDCYPRQGIDPNYPVYTIPYRDIQAVVSKVSLDEFAQDRLEKNLEDIRWLESRAFAHQRVLDNVLVDYFLVPMRFCTIYCSEQAVESLLSRYHEEFVRALDSVKDKQEWGVKVFCDQEVLESKITELSDKVREIQAQMAQKGSGAAYFLKKKLEEMLLNEAERMADERAAQSHDRLTAHADRSVVNLSQGREMVLNGAYLVAEAHLPQFRDELASLSAENEMLGFSFELTGPWPPYNFLEISLE